LLAKSRPLRFQKDEALRYGTKKNSWCFIEGIDTNDKMTIAFLKRSAKVHKNNQDLDKTEVIPFEEKTPRSNIRFAKNSTSL
jgi:hypothetical protein